MEKSRPYDSGKVEVIEHNTYEQAATAAYSEAASTGGWSFPVVMFQQGARLFLSGAFPIGFVESRLFSISADKGSNVVKAFSSLNRPEDPKHTNTIAGYLKENVGSRYIMPPLTLNVQDRVNLHTIKSGETFRAAYLVIPSDVNLSITDGQHRTKGIIRAIRELRTANEEAAKRLARDSVGVMVTCEHDFKQIHQDFADCSKTKALPPSLLSLYDTRNPGNRMVFDLEQKCHLFRGRIDSTSKTLSKNSVYLFLANQLRQMVKHFLYRRNLGDAEFEKRAKEVLGTDDQYEKYLSKYVDYINYLTGTLPILKQISELPLDSQERGQIPKFREVWVCLTATGLNVIACVGYDLFTHGISNWKEFVDKLANIDWRRSADIWQGNIIQAGRLATQTMPLKTAVDAVKTAIGLTEDRIPHRDFMTLKKIIDDTPKT